MPYGRLQADCYDTEDRDSERGALQAGGTPRVQGNVAFTGELTSLLVSAPICSLVQSECVSACCTLKQTSRWKGSEWPNVWDDSYRRHSTLVCTFLPNHWSDLSCDHQECPGVTARNGLASYGSSRSSLVAPCPRNRYESGGRGK